MSKTKIIKEKTALFVLALFAFTSFLWSIFTPVFEGPDEDSAYNYGRYYAGTWELPNITKKPVPEGAFHWEPVYFMLIGRIASLAEAPRSADSKYYYTDGWQRIWDENPVNLFKHNPGEFRFDWDRIAWSLHLMRILSVLLGCGSVWFTYKFSREVFPKPSLIPYVAMLFFAFNPQLVFFSGVANVVNMVTFMTALFLYLLSKYIKRTQNRWQDTAALGGVLGVAIISKMTALALLPVGLGLVLLQRGFRKSVGLSVVFVLAFLLTGGWYLIRNQALYGELTGAKAHVMFRFDKMINPYLEEVGILNYLISYPKTQWTTLWSGFGWLTVYLPSVFPFVMLLIYSHGIYGFLLDIWSEKSSLLRIQKKQLVAIGLTPLLVWLGITRTIFYVEVFHGKDLFLITGVLALIVVTGWRWIRIFNEGEGWLAGTKVRIIVTGLIGVLTAFWFKQFEMAKLAKGIASWSDVFWLISVAVAGMVAVRIFWTLIENKNCVRKLSICWNGRGNRWVVRATAGLLALMNLIVLFLLLVPKMYGVSLWQLLK